MNRRGRRYLTTLVSAGLLLALYFLIFAFSGQDGEQSGSLSHRISEKCVEFMNVISGGHWTGVFREQLATYFEHPIRKLAHFSEYACMGILVYTMWRPWTKRGRKLYGLTALWVFLSAAADEIHQLFVPGRYGCFADVCLDTAGGCFGVLCCVAIEKLLHFKSEDKL